MRRLAPESNALDLAVGTWLVPGVALGTDRPRAFSPRVSNAMMRLANPRRSPGWPMVAGARSGEADADGGMVQRRPAWNGSGRRTKGGPPRCEPGGPPLSDLA